MANDTANDYAAKLAKDAADRATKATEARRAKIRQWIGKALVDDATAKLDAYEIEKAYAASAGLRLDAAAASELLEVVRSWFELEDEADNDALPLRFQDALGAREFDPNEAAPDPEWLVDAMIPRAGVNVFVSLPERLKTWAALALAVAVSKGRPFLGQPARKGRVAVFDWEMGPDEVRRRLRILGADGSVLVSSFPQYALDDARFWAELEKLQPNLVVIDSLSGGSGDVGELDSRFAVPLRHAARYVAKMSARRADAREDREPDADRWICSFVFIHHSPKGARSSDVESLFRGTGAIRGAADTAYYFERLDAPDGEHRTRMTAVKSRKGHVVESLDARLTDAGGFELVPVAAPPGSDIEAAVLAAIQKTGGVSATAIGKAIGRRKADVLNACHALEARGAVHTSGAGRMTTWRPGLEPVAVPGTGSEGPAEPN